MEEFTIHCTEEQTKKAMELGAPIEEDYRHWQDIMFEEKCVRTERQLVPPTAEQMIGWLEDKGITVKIVKCDIRWFARPCSCKNTDFNKDGYCSRKEATLAAIDSALDYLIQKKGGQK